MEDVAQALDREEFALARQELNAFLQDARQEKDIAKESDYLFYLGLADQKQARISEGMERERLLAGARDFYAASLAQRRNSGMPLGPVLNNLARVYADLEVPKDDSEADRLFREAIELADSHRWLYASNHAEVAERRGDWSTAAQSYRIVVEDRPEEIEAHRRLLEIYGRQDRSALIPYLRWLADVGQVERAQEAALDLLGAPGTSAEEKLELLAVGAMTLARQLYGPEDYDQTAAAGKLTAFRSDPVIGPGVLELEELHTRDPGQDCCRWWTTSGEVRQTAVRELLFSLGRRSYAAGENGRAGLYFDQFASSGGLESPDLKTLPTLADFYFNTDRIEDLDRIARLGEQLPSLNLGSQKSLDERYSFHASLAQMLGTLGRWDDPLSPTSAVYQAGQASQIAQRSQEDVFVLPVLRTPGLNFMASSPVNSPAGCLTFQDLRDWRVQKKEESLWQEQWSGSRYAMNDVSLDFLQIMSRVQKLHETIGSHSAVTVGDRIEVHVSDFLDPMGARPLLVLRIPPVPRKDMQSGLAGGELVCRVAVAPEGRALADCGRGQTTVPSFFLARAKETLERAPWAPATDASGRPYLSLTTVRFSWE